MLTISKALNASQAARYHTKDFVSETQSYYAKDDALLGKWQGELADRLGLSGAVSKADFMALANGRNPQTQTSRTFSAARTSLDLNQENGGLLVRQRPAQRRERRSISLCIRV